MYHITAPSYLPIQNIKQIDFGQAVSGQPILSHKGVDYGLVPTSQQQERGSETLLVYHEETKTFLRKPELKEIESYNIQEVIRLPGLDSVVPLSTQSANNKARPQPKHLRMRFHPVGSKTLAPETVGSSSESEVEEITFRAPILKSKTNDEKYRKRKPDDQDLPTEKSKKSKKEEQSSQPEADADGRRDKDKIKSSKHRDETSQERRARKEEKKRRKAEKGQ